MEGEYFDNKIWNGKGMMKLGLYHFYAGEFLHGKKSGKGKEYYKEILIFEGEYLNDIKWKGKEYNENEKLIFEGEYKAVNLKEERKKGKAYYSEGQLVFEGEYYEGKEWTGKIVKYVDYNKKNEFEGEYLFGKKHGKCKEYDDGNLKFEGEYLYGEKNGKCKECNSEGKLIFEGEIIHDRYKWNGKEYNYNYKYDEIKSEYNYLYGKINGKGIEYFKGGKIRFEGEFLNDKKWNGKA